MSSKATGVVSRASESRMSLGSGCSGPGGESKADQEFELLTGPHPPHRLHSYPGHSKSQPFFMTPKVGKRGYSPCKQHLISVQMEGARY